MGCDELSNSKQNIKQATSLFGYTDCNKQTLLLRGGIENPQKQEVSIWNNTVLHYSTYRPNVYSLSALKK
jgi:hypothetical protein